MLLSEKIFELGVYVCDFFSNATRSTDTMGVEMGVEEMILGIILPVQLFTRWGRATLKLFKNK